ncbi:MAG: hypothetical protein JW936_11580 [Sedimentisphaerales bacterium]|nr:hypothetical protein [Sedimentisphaerales bacterium]
MNKNTDYQDESFDEFDDDDLLGPEDDDLRDIPAEPIEFRNFEQGCPACGKPITDEMDCCPYCGDIIFRHLRHGTFVPRKGPLARIFAAIVLALIALGIIAFIVAQLR